MYCSLFNFVSYSILFITHAGAMQIRYVSAYIHWNIQGRVCSNCITARNIASMYQMYNKIVAFT